jgi:hypothetical protein
VQFLPDCSSNILVVLSAQQKMRFIDLSKPDEFTKSYATIEGEPWSGFVFHPYHPKLIFGVSPSSSSTSPSITAMLFSPNKTDDSLKVYRTHWRVPEASEEDLAPTTAHEPSLFPRNRAQLCLDPDASTLCWWDATKTNFVCARLCPFYTQE